MKYSTQKKKRQDAKSLKWGNRNIVKGQASIIDTSLSLTRVFNYKSSLQK